MPAVASLLYHSDYVPGALVLGSRVRKLTRHHTVLLAAKSTIAPHHLALLQRVWDEVVDTELLGEPLRNLEHLQRPELAPTLTKIHCWRLPYDTVLYLDLDVLPSSDAIGELFSVEFPAGSVAAAPAAGFPDIFNSGVILLHPNQDDFDKLHAMAASAATFDGADQGLLNQYFNSDPNWVVGGDSRWVRLPFTYNATQELLTPALKGYHASALQHFGGAAAKIVHFIGAQKPWLGGSTEWWDAWREYAGSVSVQDHLAHLGVISDIQFPKRDNLAPLTPAMLCDPANYQHFESVRATQAWDATKDEPPKTAVEPAALDLAFENVWDKPADVASFEDELEVKAEEPERVFPPVHEHRHKLLAHVSLPQSEPGKLAHVGVSEPETHELAQAVETLHLRETPFDSGVPKIFPWETRRVRPERNFD